MYCISCKPIVEKQLKDEKGVKTIKFDYMTNSVIIEFDPSVLTRKEIKNRVGQIWIIVCSFSRERFLKLCCLLPLSYKYRVEHRSFEARLL